MTQIVYVLSGNMELTITLLAEFKPYCSNPKVRLKQDSHAILIVMGMFVVKRADGSVAIYPLSKGKESIFWLTRILPLTSSAISNITVC